MIIIVKTDVSGNLTEWTHNNYKKYISLHITHAAIADAKQDMSFSEKTSNKHFVYYNLSSP